MARFILFIIYFNNILFFNITFANHIDLDRNHQRQLYLKAQEYLAQNKLTAYKKIKQQLKDYPLYPYLIYDEIKSDLDGVSIKDINNFAAAYPDFYYLDNLKTQYLKHQASKKNWQNFIELYQPTDNIELLCHFFNASITLAPKPKTFAQISDLWLHGNSRPKSCDPVFDAWQSKYPLTRTLIWQRIKLALKQGNSKLASYLAQSLNDSEQKLVELWIKVHKDPYLVLQHKLFNTKHPATYEILVHGIGLIAKKNPKTAIQIWRQISSKYAFREQHWGYIVREISLSMAAKHQPEAGRWLKQIPKQFVNNQVYEWRLRTDLLHQNWPQVVKHYEDMPKSLKNHTEWQYWYARALGNLKRKKESEEILSKLAHERSYYGFLASLRLTKPYSLQNHKLLVKSHHIEQVAKIPAIQRALELNMIGDKTRSSAEWQNALKNLSEIERQAAAKIAYSYKLPNWTILALAHARNKNDLELRFPQIHAEYILTEANKHQLDPAWIFAVTRQESAFIPTAKSTAGALGLMQVLPSTARMVAKDINIPFKSRTQLFEPKTNIVLGSQYLKTLLDQFNDNAILATAAYNCGPNRLKKWLPDKPIATDIWIETIPYTQTREYVKNVLTYSIIYQELLGTKNMKNKLQKYLPLTVVKK